MEQYLNPENIYTFPTEDGKVVKIVLEGQSLDTDLSKIKEGDKNEL